MTNQPGEPVREDGNEDPPIVMTLAEMDAAFQASLAAPLGNAITWLVRYEESWWVLWERGWLRVDDEAASAELDEVAADLARAESTLRQDVLQQTLRPEFLDPPAKTHD